jgi:hypothetical protein
MSLESNRYHSRLSYDIIIGDWEASLVSVATTAMLSSCRRTLRPRRWGRKDSIAWRTTRSSFHAMCWLQS